MNVLTRLLKHIDNVTKYYPDADYYTIQLKTGKVFYIVQPSPASLPLAVYDDLFIVWEIASRNAIRMNSLKRPLHASI